MIQTNQEVVVIDAFVTYIRRAANNKSIRRMCCIEFAREEIRKMTKQEIKEIVVESKKMNKIELKILINVGLPKLIRKDVLQIYADKIGGLE